MKVVTRRKYGLPNQIKVEHLEKPIPNDNEVLIKVYATTVNRTDCANLTAKPFIMRFILGLFKPREIILGTDFSGEVMALGKNVKSFKLGDKVFGFKDTGLKSQAEYLSKAITDLYTIPENISYGQAAASLEGAHYAYTFVHKVTIQQGQKVLINGATGAIGSALLQFVRQYNVQITVTCNTQNRELMESLGADKIYDYTQEDFTSDNEKYDYIFDAVGKSRFVTCKPLLKEKGIYISSELGPNCENLLYAITTSISKGKKVIFPVPFSTTQTIPYIISLLKNEKFKPVIDRMYPLDDIDLAYKYVLGGEKTGNVIVNVNAIVKSHN